MSVRATAALGLSILLLVLISIGQCVDARWDRARLARQNDALKAELAGANVALAAKPKVIVEKVKEYVPQEVIKLVKEKVLVPVAGATIETPGQTVTIPCPPSVSTGQAVEADIDVSIKGGLLLTMTKAGDPYWNGSLTTTLRGPTWTRAVAHTLDPTTVTVDINTDIIQDLRAHNNERFFKLAPRPIKQWRMGWTIGGGVGYDPVRQDVVPVVAVLYGLQW